VGGCYRLIDIPMSNCINSGINKICVLTQFNSASLNRHISRTYFGNGINFGDGFIEVRNLPNEYLDVISLIFFFSVLFVLKATWITCQLNQRKTTRVCLISSLITIYLALERICIIGSWFWWGSLMISSVPNKVFGYQESERGLKNNCHVLSGIGPN
jgi:hypothetical protein